MSAWVSLSIGVASDLVKASHRLQGFPRVPEDRYGAALRLWAKYGVPPG